jgi:TfuA protein
MVFSSGLSVTPMECRQIMEEGWELIGASSIGALRASELWSVGMIGVGKIFYQYRLGYSLSDSDVATMINPKTYEEVTASLVHIQWILFQLQQRNLLSGILSRKLIKKSKAYTLVRSHVGYLH